MLCPYRDVSQTALEAADISLDVSGRREVTRTGIPAYIQSRRPSAWPSWKAEQE